MIRPAPRTEPPRNGLPGPKPYRWRGGLADERTPAEIVADLHRELAKRRRRRMFVTVDCLHRDCPACTDARCRCPCHDDDEPLPIPVPVPVRCRRCGYLTSAPGHQITCEDPDGQR